MHYVLPMSRGDAGANWLDQFERAQRRHRAFFGHDVLQRFALYELHHQKGHRAAHHAKVRDRNDVLMADGGSSQRFLTKARGQVRIVADQIGKNDFDRVQGLEKDVATFEDYTHAALAQPPLELIAAIEDRFASDRVRGCHAIVRAISHVVGVTITAGWTLSHALVLLLHRARAGQDIAKKILAVIGAGGKERSSICGYHLQFEVSRSSFAGLTLHPAGFNSRIVYVAINQYPTAWQPCRVLHLFRH